MLKPVPFPEQSHSVIETATHDPSAHRPRPELVWHEHSLTDTRGQAVSKRPSVALRQQTQHSHEPVQVSIERPIPLLSEHTQSMMSACRPKQRMPPKPLPVEQQSAI